MTKKKSTSSRKKQEPKEEVSVEAAEETEEVAEIAATEEAAPAPPSVDHPDPDTEVRARLLPGIPRGVLNHSEIRAGAAVVIRYALLVHFNRLNPKFQYWNESASSWIRVPSE